MFYTYLIKFAACLLLCSLWVSLKRGIAQKRDSLKVTVTVKQKDRDNYIPDVDIYLNGDNQNKATNANGVSVFYIDSARYDRKQVRINARHPDYHLPAPAVENIGEVNEFEIEMRLKLIVSGQVINQHTNMPVVGAKVTVYDSENPKNNIEKLTDANGVYYSKVDIPNGSKVEVFVEKEGFEPSSVRNKRVHLGDKLDLSLVPLEKDPDLYGLQGIAFNTKTNDRLSDITITDETRSLRTLTDSSGQYILNKVDPDWKELKLLVESPRIGKFPFRRYQYILTKPRNKQSQSIGLDGSVDLGLRKNIIINQDRWILTAGLALLGGVSQVVAHCTYNNYETDPRNFSRYTTARTFQDVSTVFFTLSGLSFTANLLFLNKRPVTSRVVLGIK